MAFRTLAEPADSTRVNSAPRGHLAMSEIVCHNVGMYVMNIELLRASNSAKHPIIQRTVPYLLH